MEFLRNEIKIEKKRLELVAHGEDKCWFCERYASVTCVGVCTMSVCAHTDTHRHIPAKMYFPLGSQAGVLENTGLEESLQDSAGKARGV